jgi:hypothetical protein
MGYAQPGGGPRVITPRQTAARRLYEHPNCALVDGECGMSDQL